MKFPVCMAIVLLSVSLSACGPATPPPPTASDLPKLLIARDTAKVEQVFKSITDLTQVQPLIEKAETYFFSRGSSNTEPAQKEADVAMFTAVHRGLVSNATLKLQPSTARLAEINSKELPVKDSRAVSVVEVADCSVSPPKDAKQHRLLLVGADRIMSAYRISDNDPSVPVRVAIKLAGQLVQTESSFLPDTCFEYIKLGTAASGPDAGAAIAWAVSLKQVATSNEIEGIRTKLREENYKSLDFALKCTFAGNSPQLATLITRQKLDLRDGKITQSGTFYRYNRPGEEPFLWEFSFSGNAKDFTDGALVYNSVTGDHYRKLYIETRQANVKEMWEYERKDWGGIDLPTAVTIARDTLRVELGPFPSGFSDQYDCEKADAAEMVSFVAEQKKVVYAKELAALTKQGDEAARAKEVQLQRNKL